MAPYIRTKKHRLLQSIKKRGKLNYMYGKVSSHKGKTSFEYTKDDIYNLYWNKKLTIEEIAKCFGCTSSNIHYFMKSQGIKRRKRCDAYTFGYTRYRKKAFREYPNICFNCGSLDRLEVHHIDGNHKNHDIKNLRILCILCHKQEHQRRYKENINKICLFCKKQHNRYKSDFCSASCWSKYRYYILNIKR